MASSDAINNPVKRQYNRAEVNTGDMPVGQRADIDMDSKIIHGQGIINASGDTELNTKFHEDLAFNEEPVTIRIEENSGSDFPETYVPVYVNGKGAEVFYNGRWQEVGWLPIGMEVTTRRKSVEQLARSKVEIVRTQHGDTREEKPQNKVVRRNKSAYALTVLQDDNPKGREWLSRVLAGF